MVLVTGSKGTIGSQVVQELLEQGAGFYAGVHSRPLESEGVESRTIDFDRPETLPSALEDVSTVYLVSYETLHERALVPAAQDAGVELPNRANDGIEIAGHVHGEGPRVLSEAAARPRRGSTDRGSQTRRSRRTFQRHDTCPARVRLGNHAGEESIFHLEDHLPDARIHEIPAVGHLAPELEPEPVAEVLVRVFEEQFVEA